MNLLRSHLPSFIDWLAAGRDRAKFMIMAHVSSHAEIVFEPTAFMTSTEFSLADTTSMLSTPVPARAISFNEFDSAAAEMISLVTFVAERTTKQS